MVVFRNEAHEQVQLLLSGKVTDFPDHRTIGDRGKAVGIFDADASWDGHVDANIFGGLVARIGDIDHDFKGNTKGRVARCPGANGQFRCAPRHKRLAVP